MATVSILGAGSWGTALACHLARSGHRVRLWARSASHAAVLADVKENTRYLPGVSIPSGVTVTADLPASLRGSEAVVFAVPSHAFGETVSLARPYLPPVPVINAAKGIEEDTLRRLSQVWADLTGDRELQRYCALSGPSHAEELGRAMPTALVAASPVSAVAEFAQDLFMSPCLRVYTNRDLTGVETGGALKNIIAVATGVSDGLGFGDNTRAALMTRGLAEITRLGVRMGANPLTFAGLTGVGDLIVTCTSMHSRNRRFGMAVGRGLSVQEALVEVSQIVEGVRTTRAATRLAVRFGVELPIARQVYAILFEGLTPSEGVNLLMTRQRRHEIEEVALYGIAWKTPE
ncbi:MAG: NAD(P)H-dependent glycerol-3-phosphate dehydrogenase [Thermoanaerobacterales bacterium]|nr:NAD(P)H-dependent glycerol-3-phosphate dehydrogenase [Bacillota bacterium]MDI6906294.1 NAD(P)H-dependent glycerol-3-phosphate dehydrogenase [Thermoanaerobacterales bacterium]